MDAQRVAYDLLDAITTRRPAPAAQEAPQSATELVALCVERLRKLREGPDAGYRRTCLPCRDYGVGSVGHVSTFPPDP
jgi:hypothetical protein